MKISWYKRRGSAPLHWMMNIGGCGCLIYVGYVLLAVSVHHEHARRPSCLSNLKQVGLAFEMYCQDYDQRFPPAKQWADSTYPDAQTLQIYRCPAQVPDHPSFTYAYNSSASKRLQTEIPDPANWPLAFDSISTEWNAVSNGFAGLATPPRHNGGNNVVFADFHAKWRPSTPR